jgi:hypothetical protein
MVFLETRSFVKQNNTEFTNVSSFTSLSCRILLFPSSPPTIFFKFMYSEITGKSPWQVLFRPPSLAVEGYQN